MIITEKIAKKVLKTVDCGLSSGLGKPIPGQMCVEAAVCFALGLPHGDEPDCVDANLRDLKIALNDCSWSSPYARAEGLRRLAVIQLGSVGCVPYGRFSKMVTELVVKATVARAIRAAASHALKHARVLRKAAKLCQKTGSLKAVDAAFIIASTACNETSSITVLDILSELSEAIGTLPNKPSTTVMDAVSSLMYVITYGIVPAKQSAALGDKVLADFAEGVVKILIKLKVPGRKWLKLTK